MNFDVVVVLGMHRSGTSALTKALELFGIDLGKELLPPNPENPKGYFESAGLVALNDRILVKCDSHWTSLQFLDSEKLGGPDLAAEKKEARQLLASKISPGIPLGLKDPRLCRTLPFWQELFREKNLRVGYVLSYRHPAEVAASLKKRDDLPMEYGLNLWASYQTDALLHVEGAPWIAVGFENLLENTATELARLAAFLGLAWDPEKPAVRTFEKEFLDVSLRHQRSDKPFSHASVCLQKLAEAMVLACRSKGGGGQEAALLAMRQFLQEAQPISRLVCAGNRNLYLGLVGNEQHFEIFYATQANDFSEKRKILKKIKIIPGQRLAQTLVIPAEASEAPFWRIDPSYRSGKFSIRSLKFLSADQRVMWDLQDHRDQVMVQGTASALPLPAVGIELVSIGEDPILLLPQLPQEALPITLLQIELEIAPVAEAIDAVSRAHVAHEAHQQAVIAHKQEQVSNLEKALKSKQGEVEANRLTKEWVEKSIGGLKGELAEQREAEEASIRGLKEELLAEIRSLMEKLEEQRESDRKKTEAQFLSAQTGTEGRIKDLEGYAEAMHEAVLSPASTYLPAPFSWYAMLYKMMNIKKPASLKQGLTSPAQSPRPGFWRRMEQGIRKRRKYLQAWVGFDRNWYLQEYQDVAQAGIEPFEHYFYHGLVEGRWKSKKDKIQSREKLEKKSKLKKKTGQKWFRKKQDSVTSYSSQLQKLDKTKKTVLLVTHEISRTGAPILALNLAKELKKNYNVLVISLGNGDLLLNFKESCDLFIGPLVGEQSDQNYLADFLEEINKRQPIDCAIVNSIVATKILKPLWQNNIPAAHLIHEFSSYTRPRTIFRESALFSMKQIYPTQIVRENAFLDLPDLRNKATMVLPQGRCHTPFNQRKNEKEEKERLRIESLLRPPGSPEPLFVVVGLGTVQLRKGLDLFVECARQVSKLNSKVPIRFVWFGHGYNTETDLNYSVYLHDQIRRSGIEEICEITHETDHLDHVYHKADLLLLSSRLDPLPLVAQEMMAYKKPVVCFDKATGLAEFLSDDSAVKKCVIEFFNVEKAAATILELANNRVEYSRIGNALENIVSKTFNFEIYSKKISKLCEELTVLKQREKEDFQIIKNSGLLKNQFFQTEYNVCQSSEQFYLSLWSSGCGRRKPFPGFHPGIYSERNSIGQKDPLADYLRKGRPVGPWTQEVIHPEEIRNRDFIKLEVPTALHLHLYYNDMADFILARVALCKSRPDLLISVQNIESKEEVSKLLLKHNLEATKISIVPNLGRDMGPFLTEFREEILNKYEIIGHIHSKKSLCINNAEHVKKWFDFLLENLISGQFPMMDVIIKKMTVDSTIGLVYPDDPFVVDWGKNKEFAEKLLRQMQIKNLNLFKNINFPVGTMFWARTKALKPLFDLQLEWSDYPNEPLPYDGSMLHAIERLLPIICENQNYKSMVTNVPNITR